LSPMFYRRCAPWLYFGVLLLLMAVLVVGVSAKGAARFAWRARLPPDRRPMVVLLKQSPMGALGRECTTWHRAPC